MTEQPLPPPPPPRWIKKAAIAIVLVVILLVSIFVVLSIPNLITSTSSSNQQPQNQFTISSFNSTVGDDPNIQAYVDLKVDNYAVNGNTVDCSGTITLRTTQYTLSNYALCLLITSNSYSSPYALNAQLIGYGGALFLPTFGYSIINSTSVDVPTLGNGTNVYDFSLECPCSPLS
jgi:competence protein ComGC